LNVIRGLKNKGNVVVSALRLCALAATVGFASLAASPAMADIVMVDASSIQGANVLFNTGTQTSTMVIGRTQVGTQVNFTGTTTVAMSSVLPAGRRQSRATSTQ